LRKAAEYKAITDSACWITLETTDAQNNKRGGATVYKKLCIAALAIMAVLSSGCQTNRNNGYADLVNRPAPSSDAEREQECAWLRSEVARQQSLSQIGAASATTPMMAIAYQSMARRNIANLESRYSQIQCDVIRVAPTQPAVSSPAGSGMSFDQCFAKCRQLTGQSESQCFDTCRH
jgi:hypothetical protein